MQLTGRAEVVELLRSSRHRYAGRPADGPAPAEPGELVQQIVLKAGLGIVGDRYFGRPAHRDASITLMAVESLHDAGLPSGTGLAETRRNVLLSGLAVDDLVGCDLELDSGDGPFRLRVNRAARPCGWLDVMIESGARSRLRGRGGVRCTPLTDGCLRLGPVEFVVHPEQR